MTAIHLFPKEIDKHENVCYSVLDIYSKNVYMVYLLKVSHSFDFTALHDA